MRPAPDTIAVFLTAARQPRAPGCITWNRNIWSSALAADWLTLHSPAPIIVIFRVARNPDGVFGMERQPRS